MTKVTFKDGTKIIMNTTSGFIAVVDACQTLNKKIGDVQSTKLIPNLG